MCASQNRAHIKCSQAAFQMLIVWYVDNQRFTSYMCCIQTN